MNRRILVMGLPGSGKTTLAKKLVERLGYSYLNADELRKLHNDWDFSVEGRLRQAVRMHDLSSNGKFVCDFVCPLKETRLIFQADITIWMDTISSGRYADTNQMFETPEEYDLRIADFNYDLNEIVTQASE